MGKKIFVSIYLIILFSGAFLYSVFVDDKYCLAFQNTTIRISEHMKPVDPLSYDDNWAVVCYDNRLERDLNLMKIKNINLDITIK